MDNYIIIGASHLQLDFIMVVKKAGLCAHVVDYNPDAPGAKAADFFHRISIDDKESILAIAKKFNIVGIHTVATEQGNISACYVAEKLELACNSYQVALNTTNKVLMRQIVSSKKLDNTKYFVVNSLSQLEGMIINYPVMVKATDRSAGRGVQRVDTENELLAAVKEGMAASFEKAVIIESLIKGLQYSVETLSYKGKHQIVAITEQWIDDSAYCVETGHYLPARLSDTDTQIIEEFCIKLLNAFDIEYGACHIEVRLQGRQIAMIEFASRMGGWRHWMIDAALNVNYLKAILKSTLDQYPFVTPKVSEDIAMCRIITKEEDYKVYKNFISGHKEMLVVSHVHNKAPKKRARSLIDASGFYIYLSNNRFERDCWPTLSGKENEFH